MPQLEPEHSAPDFVHQKLRAAFGLLQRQRQLLLGLAVLRDIWIRMAVVNFIALRDLATRSSVFARLFEKYGTLIERYTALIEKSRRTWPSLTSASAIRWK
eukprot:SAG31_NODE_32199_length_358_cov_2.146718_1_plen_100_part_10